MSSDVERWWSLTHRRRIVVATVTIGSGLLGLVVGALTRGPADAWPDVFAIGLTVSGLALMITTMTAPMSGDRPDWRNPIPALDGRTKRRALRCIRRGDADGAPSGVDLRAVAYYWGRQSSRTIRSSPGLGLVFVGGAVIDHGLWMRIIRVASLVVFAAVAVYVVRDIRSCRRFLITKRTERPEQRFDRDPRGR